jgi:hypothetical protein
MIFSFLFPSEVSGFLTHGRKERPYIERRFLTPMGARNRRFVLKGMIRFQNKTADR